MLYVCTISPTTARIHSNISLEVGLPDVIGLENIKYYYSITDILNSYLANHVVSTDFAIYIEHLFSYYMISNHHFTCTCLGQRLDHNNGREVAILHYMWRFPSQSPLGPESGLGLGIGTWIGAINGAS